MGNQISVQLVQVAASASKASIRDHSVLIDRPAAKGGADRGPMGGELFLASLGGCFMSNLLAAIATREARLSDVRTEVTAILDGTPPRFTSVRLSVTAEGPDQAMLAKLIQIADRGCIMTNTVREMLDLKITDLTSAENERG
jgi:putative redox protein